MTMIVLLLLFASSLVLSGAAVINDDACPCTQTSTCLDEKLTMLSLNVASYKGFQGYFNDTLHPLLATIENKVGLHAYKFPLPKAFADDGSGSDVPTSCISSSSSSSQTTNQVYQEKLKFLNAIDNDVVSAKKRWEDLVALYSTRLLKILNHLNALEKYT